MTKTTILANAKLVLEDEIIHGSLLMRDGKIQDMDQGRAVPKGAIDCEGDHLCPGLIELHTDNLERHLKPRPGVHWPKRAAIVAHDRELAGAGITTVFDAIRVGSILSDDRKRYGKYAREMANEIVAMRELGALSISHLIHLRAEICSETLVEELAEFDASDQVGIVSLMDHTPGQRQFRDLQQFEDYVCGKHGLARAGFGDYCDFLRGLREKLGVKHEAAAVRAATRLGATLASHDDTTTEHVQNSKAQGVTLAEFPTSVEAAEACHTESIAIIMGAPNLVRGGSHSGNVAASDLAQRDRLQILSSDYVPASLLLGAVQLGTLWGNMARGLGTVTKAPAMAVGLKDRGELTPNMRADLTQFTLKDDIPVIKAVYANAERVA